MKSFKTLAVAGLVILVLAGTALSQESTEIIPVKLSGFRIGLTYIPGDAITRALDDKTAIPLLAQFGWQFERQFPAGKSGLSAIVEVLPLVGGMNLGIFIPSVSMLIGIRTKNGYEIGAGPQVSLAGSEGKAKVGTGMVFGAGMTRRIGNLYIPLNFAIAQGRASGEKESGMKMTLITGFAIK
jgi:hypothetical protein